MEELIRMSLFCDVSDMATNELTEGKAHAREQYPSEQEHLSGRVCSLQDDKLTEQQQHSSPSRHSQPQTSSCSHNSTGTTSFNVSAYFDYIQCQSKVDFSTFRNVSADEIFGNDYMQPIVECKKAKSNIIKPKVTRKKTPSCLTSRFKYNFGETVIERPPYTYNAMSTAAIYLSERKSLTRWEVIQRVREMFEAFRVDCPKWQTTWRKNILKGSDWQKRVINKTRGMYSINYSELNTVVFNRILCEDVKKLDGQYADNLFEQLGIPEKLVALQKLAGKSSEPKITNKASIPDTLLQEDSTKRRKVSSLRLPTRPCFQDDNSTDSLCLNMKPTNDDKAKPDVSKPEVESLGELVQPENIAMAPLNGIYFIDTVLNGCLVKVPVEINGLWL